MKVQLARKSCYPDNVIVTEKGCEVKLQNVLEHLLNRLFQFLKLDCVDSPKKSEVELTLHCKYGFDGTNVEAYQQKKADKNERSDKIFATSLVPLLLINEDSNEVFFENERPSSTSLTLPVSIFYEKETPELCRRHKEDLREQIDQLECVKIGRYKVSFRLSGTMIDGKVRNFTKELSL